MTTNTEPMAADQGSSADLAELVDLSLTLGLPEHDLVILAEGNTSTLTRPGSFAVKASGAQMSLANAMAATMRLSSASALSNRCRISVAHWFGASASISSGGVSVSAVMAFSSACPKSGLLSRRDTLGTTRRGKPQKA